MNAMFGVAMQVTAPVHIPVLADILSKPSVALCSPQQTLEDNLVKIQSMLCLLLPSLNSGNKDLSTVPINSKYFPLIYYIPATINTMTDHRWQG